MKRQPLWPGFLLTQSYFLCEVVKKFSLPHPGGERWNLDKLLLARPIRCEFQMNLIQLTDQKSGSRRLWTHNSLWAELERGDTPEVSYRFNKVMIYTTDLRAGHWVLSDPFPGPDQKFKVQVVIQLIVESHPQGYNTHAGSGICHVITLWAYWCCPVHRLSWGCQSPSLSPLWSPRSPAETSCLREWCQWSSPHSLETSACRHSVSPRC